MIEGMSPIPPSQAGNYDPTKQQERDVRLKKAVTQYEEVFLKELFSEMRKTLPKTDIFGKSKHHSKEKDMFEGMLDGQRAKAWAESGGIGIASMMYEQLKHQNGAK